MFHVYCALSLTRASWRDSAHWKCISLCVNTSKKVTTLYSAADADFDEPLPLYPRDTVAHISDDDLNVTINMDILKNITTALKDAFPDKKVYASFGNHDYYPSDQFPDFNNIIYNRTAEMWESWIEEPEQMANFRKGECVVC